MKYLKTKNISRFSISDNTYIQNTNGRITIDSNNSLRLPKGTTTQRPGYNPADPDVISAAWLPNMNGSIRYNTTTNTVEAYIDNKWEAVRTSGSTTVIKQVVGQGDYSQTIFGPLAQIPPVPAVYSGSTPNTDYDFPVIVLIENVFQISGTNYDILYNYLGSGNAYIEFTSPPPLGKDITVYFGFGN